MTDATAVEPMLVNLGELADVLGHAPATLQRLMKDETFPVESRGKNGVPYQFDAGKVKAWLDANKAREDEARKQRLAELRQYRLDLFPGSEDMLPDGAGDKDPETLRRELELQAALRREGIERGQLVRAADVRAQVENAMVALRQEMGEVVPRIARAAQLDRAGKDSVNKIIRAALARYADRLQGLAPDTAATATFGAQDTDAHRAA